jgi:hypothetical protein
MFETCERGMASSFWYYLNENFIQRCLHPLPPTQHMAPQRSELASRKGG